MSGIIPISNCECLSLTAKLVFLIRYEFLAFPRTIFLGYSSRVIVLLLKYLIDSEEKLKDVYISDYFAISTFDAQVHDGTSEWFWLALVSLQTTCLALPNNL